jgi:O-antigen ligase
MSNGPPPSVAETVASSRPTPWLAFLFVWGCFYFADPLEPLFSTTEEMHLDESDLETMERVDRNIEHVQSGSVGRQVGGIALGLFGLWHLLKPSPRRLRITAPLGEAIVVFLAWCGLSLFWSDLPVMTLRKLLVLGCLCAGALGMARAWSLRHIVCFAVFSGALLLVPGIACEIALGTFQPLHPAYRFSGLTWPAYSAWNLSVLVCAVLALRHDRPGARPALRVLLDLLAVWATVMIVLTKTRASLGALVVAVLLHVAATWPWRRMVLGGVLLALATSATVLVSEALGGNLGNAVVEAVNLGRTESVEDISGRADLWRELMAYFGQRPLIGYGYETFWTPDRLLAVGRTNWGAPDAHNGYLNLALGTGLIGSGIYTLILLLGAHRAWVGFRASGNADYLFGAQAVVILAINTGFVSTQLAPALHCFVVMLVLAHLGFAQEEPGVTDQESALPRSASEPLEPSS